MGSCRTKTFLKKNKIREICLPNLEIYCDVVIKTANCHWHRKYTSQRTRISRTSKRIFERTAFAEGCERITVQ